MRRTHSQAAAAVTLVGGATAWWLTRGPVARRAVPERDSCGIPADCLADVELWGAVGVALVLEALAWAVLLSTVLGLSSIAIGRLVHRRWPDAPVATAGAGLLTYAPPLLLTAATIWLATIAHG